MQDANESDQEDDAEAASRSGNADPIGDDQTTRSGWGGLDECSAVEGGTVNTLTITGPYRRVGVLGRIWRRVTRR